MPDGFLVGIWLLRSFVIVDNAGCVLTQPMGDHPEGFLIYTADGYMSVHIRRQSDVARGSSPGGSRPDSGESWDVETVALTHDYVGYGGPYELAGDHVVNHVTIASVPAWIGTKQTRRIEQHGDVLILHPVAATPSDRVARLTWTRAESAAVYPSQAAADPPAGLERQAPAQTVGQHSPATPNVVLDGSGGTALRRGQRYIHVSDPTHSVKVPCGNGYDHFTPTTETRYHGGSQLRVFAWSHRTYIAE